ncbi:PAS domain S-box protein [Methylocaldum sp. GT1TLB]|uniref:PAS domain S-box protein n=1 Tax=Methylocaldum sp. GT1TLB TaxID=3438965 RepID=UPI003D9FD9F9
MSTAERDIPASRPDFQVLFQSVPACILVLAPDSPYFTILAASDAYLRATKKRREEIVGRPVFEVFPDNPDSPFGPEANSRASFERVLRHRLPDAQAMRQHDIRRPEQGGGFEGRFSKSSNTPVLDENGDVLYIIHHVEDVAEPVRAEQEPRAETSPVDAGGSETGAEARPDAAHIRREADAAREREECYSAIFDKAPFGMALTKMPERTLVAVNDAFLKIFECSREDVLGKNSGHLGIPDEWLRGRIASELRQCAALRDVEITHKSRSGARLVLSLNVDWVGIGGQTLLLSTIQDITERKQVEESLRREQSLLDSVMRATDVMLVFLDRQFNFVWVNPAYAETCRMRPEDMVGNNHFALYPNAENEAIFRKVRDSGDAVFYKDRPFVFPDQPERGTTYWDWSLTPVKGNDGATAGLVFSLRETTKFKRAQEAFCQSEERFRALVMASSQTIYRMSSDWTEMYQLYGRDFLADTEEPSRNWLQKYIPSDDQPQVVAAIGEAIRTKSIFELEHRVRRADGSLGWTFSRAVPLMSADGDIVEWFGAASNITERKQAEEALRENRAQLEAELQDTQLLQSISAALLHEDDIQALYEKIIDAAAHIMHSEYASMQMLYPERGRGGELRLLAFRGFNPQAAKFWEWVSADSSDSTCGAALRTGRRVIAPDLENCDFMQGTEDLATYLQTGIHACQTTPLFSRSGKLVGMISTHWRCPHQPSERDLRLLDILARQAADLIDRKRAEEALRESEEKYRTLFECMDEGFCTIEVLFDESERPVDYRFLIVNPAFERQSGIRDAVGRRIREIAPLLEEHWFEIFGKIALTGQPMRFENFAAQLHRHYDVYAFRIGAPSERKVAVLFNDITRRKLIEETLRKADRRKDEFLAMLAHELRNPLAPLRTGLHVLRKSDGTNPATERTQTLLTMMERQVNHLVRLVDDLLEVSRITQGKIALKKERVDLATIVGHAVETSQALIEAGNHTLEVSLPPEPVCLDADPVRLTQVLSNLLNNAAKYMAAGGHVWLLAERQGPDAVVSIRDEGIGISAEMLPHVFDLFTQADRSIDRSQGGLGLGLSLVRHLVELHGGSVEARSEGPGLGSEFVVRLPLAWTGP